jgi:hypothetical protein
MEEGRDTARTENLEKRGGGDRANENKMKEVKTVSE